MPAGEIERFVVDQIRAVGRDPTLVAETLRHAQRQQKECLERLEAERRVLDRELARLNDGVRLVLGAAARDEAARGRLADLQDRIRKGEQRALEIRQEMVALEREQVNEADMATALSQFDPVWESLAPREQARVVQLLVERVAYDGRDGQISVTFRPTGIKTLVAELASREEVEA